jgi:hypothetical protein
MYEAMQIGMFVLLIVVVVVLAVLLVQCKNKDNFCGTCQGMSNKVCTNRPLLSHMYQAGKLTENSHLQRSKEWPSITWDRFQSYGERKNPCHNSL